MLLLIKNGRILTMDGTVLEDGCVLIEDGRIQAVAPRIPERGARVFDAKGGVVMPGLIDPHSHIGILEEKRGMPGDDCNETVQAVTPQLRAIDAINPMDGAFMTALGAGITGVMAGPGSSNVVGGQFAFLKTFGRCVDEMTVLAPAALKVAFGENPKANYQGQGMMPTTRMSIAAMLREELFRARAYQRKKQAAQEQGEDFEEDFRLECYLPVLERRIPLKAHVHRADDILTAIRIAKEFDLRLTLDHCTEGHLIAKEIRESGFPAIVGPSLASRNKVEVQYLDFKTAGILHKAGIPVALTTDHPVSRIQYLGLCAGLAARDGLGEEQALLAVTRTAAEIAGVADRAGTLTPGKDADIAVFSQLPTQIGARTLLTLVNGDIAYLPDGMPAPEPV